MYGESESIATLELTTEPAPVESAGGCVVLIASRQWPRSDENALPSAVRVMVDTDGNNVADHVATVRVRLADLDRNGRWERELDGVMLDPVSVERIDPSIQLCFSAADWRATVKRAAAGL